MEYEDVSQFVLGESKQGPLFIYIAIGCSLEYYANKDEYPKQQYPPFMSDFPYRQICVLIDPRLEMPPRCTDEVVQLDVPYEITILPIVSSFEFPTHMEFLHSLIRLCVDPSLRMKMIVQDFTGRDIRPYYPIQMYGDALLHNVLFDATYGDGGCYPDLSTIAILQNAGNFVHPMYSTLCGLSTLAPSSIVKREFTLRRHSIYMMSTVHRVTLGVEEPRDWCKKSDMPRYIPQYMKVYAIPELGLDETIRTILMMTLKDICRLAEIYLTPDEMDSIVDGNGRNFDTMWKIVETML